VQAAKSNLSVSMHGVPSPAHGLSGWFCSCQSHRNQSALAKDLRSSTPRPPSCNGRPTVGQFTLHLPPNSTLSPAHKKRFLNLSRSSRNSVEVLMIVSRYTSWDESTYFVKTTRPACVRFRPRQAFSFPATISTNGCRSVLFRRYTMSNRPRYLIGKLPCWVWNSCKKSSRSSSVHLYWHHYGLLEVAVQASDFAKRLNYPG